MKFAFENLLPRLLCDGLAKTVKTVQITSARSVTPLKRGVNEIGLAKRVNERGRLFLLVCSFAVVSTAKAASVFDDFVRVTEALTPQQQLTNFHLPPGFEMQLVASEPQIGKPM